MIDNYRDSRNRSNSSRDVVYLKRRNCYSSFEIKAIVERELTSSSFDPCRLSRSIPAYFFFFFRLFGRISFKRHRRGEPPLSRLPADPASHNFHRGRCMNVGRGEGGEEEERDASAYI